MAAWPGLERELGVSGRTPWLRQAGSYSVKTICRPLGPSMPVALLLP